MPSCSSAEAFADIIIGGGKGLQKPENFKLIWDLAEVIEHLSAAWELAPGDMIFSGTPEGVAAVVAGDTLVGEITGLPSLTVQIV